MKNTNEELFKQALEEGISRHFDRLVASCKNDIEPSEEHYKIMRAILNGTYKEE